MPADHHVNTAVVCSIQDLFELLFLMIGQRLRKHKLKLYVQGAKLARKIMYWHSLVFKLHHLEWFDNLVALDSHGVAV